MAGDANADPVKQAQKIIRQGAGQASPAPPCASQTDAGFRERWALFWFNHFTVGQKNLQTVVLVGPFEREAIRPHAFGRFEDLLVASSSHPAMLVYLDQAQSIGPNSPFASLSRIRCSRRLADGLETEAMAKVATTSASRRPDDGQRVRRRPKAMAMQPPTDRHSRTSGGGRAGHAQSPQGYAASRTRAIDARRTR